jgi:hypothetical protein
MICPSKTCKFEIDDDSKFCDQCGSEILICPKCGRYGVDKFCEQDGQKLESLRKKIQRKAETQPVQDTKQKPVVQDEASQSDIHEAPAADQLKLVHSSGKELMISHGDLLGKKEGAHKTFLSGFKYISGKHAVFSNQNRQWFIKDLNSSNKTKINGKAIVADKDQPVKAGDKITLADQEFSIPLK